MTLVQTVVTDGAEYAALGAPLAESDSTTSSVWIVIYAIAGVLVLAAAAYAARRWLRAASAHYG